MFGFRHAMREGRHGRGFDGHHAGPRGRFGHGEGPRGGWSEDGPGFGRGGGRRRMFDGGELRLVLLKLIAEKPRHGYDLIRAIEERTGGAYAPSPGIVYPTLTMLSDMGLIEEQTAEGARKLFAITPEALRILPSMMPKWSRCWRGWTRSAPCASAPMRFRSAARCIICAACCTPGSAKASTRTGRMTRRR